MIYLVEKSLETPSAKKSQFKLDRADSGSSEGSFIYGMYSHNVIDLSGQKES